MIASTHSPANRTRRDMPAPQEIRHAAARIRRGWNQAERHMRRRAARFAQLRLLELATCAAA